MAEGQDRDAEDGVDHLPSVVRQAERPRHHAQAEAADRGGHHEPMFEHAAPKRHDSKADRNAEADLMDERMEQDAARRREHREENGAGEAVDEAQAGQGDAQPVDRSPLHCRRKVHFQPLLCCCAYMPPGEKLQHHMSTKVAQAMLERVHCEVVRISGGGRWQSTAKAAASRTCRQVANDRSSD